MKSAHQINTIEIMENLSQTRRSFIGKLTSAAIAASLPGINAYSNSARTLSAGEISAETFTICAFSKIFDQLGKDMFPFLAEIGFEGIDLTVRPGGYVLPENVEKDLPKAVNAATKKGLSVPMISTAINEASETTTRKILKTASECGVKYYRPNWFRYDNSLGIERNLDLFRKRLAGLCELNVKYGLQANYQNHYVFNSHQGGIFGSPVWDLWTVIKDMDPRYIGCQYDIYHAVAEGFTSWQLGLKAIRPHIGTVSVKDFILDKTDGKWAIKTVPMGTGVVDFDAFFKIIRDEKITCPISLFFEFPVLDKTEGTLSVKDKMKKMYPVVKGELNTLKSFMKLL